jgi:DNA-binding CsgD family transcriptional regulator
LLDSQLLHGHFLTAREGQVLQLLMRRLTNTEISSALAISERTVKFHVSNILSKLQLPSAKPVARPQFVLVQQEIRNPLPAMFHYSVTPLRRQFFLLDTGRTRD